MKFAVALFALYIGIGVGKNTVLFSDREWEDQGELGCSLRIREHHQLKDNWYGELGYYHFSQCGAGKPFNDLYEDTSDHFYYYIEYKIY